MELPNSYPWVLEVLSCITHSERLNTSAISKSQPALSQRWCEAVAQCEVREEKFKKKGGRKTNLLFDNQIHAFLADECSSYLIILTTTCYNVDMSEQIKSLWNDCMTCDEHSAGQLSQQFITGSCRQVLVEPLFFLGQPGIMHMPHLTSIFPAM